MLDSTKEIIAFLKGRDPTQLAKVFAYVFAPAAVMAAGLLGLAGRGMAVDLSRPVAISELRSEIDGTGHARLRRGLAITVESSAPEFHLSLSGTAGAVWTSLEPEQLQANAGRIQSDSAGLTTRSPFLGVSGPVTMIIAGAARGQVDLPGRTERVSDWQLPSRQSLALVSSVLLSCVFAFGMAVAMVLPSPSGEQRATR